MKPGSCRHRKPEIESIVSPRIRDRAKTDGSLGDAPDAEHVRGHPACVAIANQPVLNTGNNEVTNFMTANTAPDSAS